MRILQVFDYFSLAYGGGTVDVMSNLSRALQQRGHEVTICTSDYRLDHFDSLNFKVFHSWVNLPTIRITPSIIGFDIKKFDIIHLHCYRSFQNAVIYEKAMKHHIPYVIDAHGSTEDPKGAKNLVRKLFDYAIGYRALRNAHKLIAETEVGVREFEKLGAKRDKIVELHPLFDISEFSNLPERGLFRKKYDIKEQYITLFVGRINWIKGLDFLAESISQLKDVMLVIVGQDDGYKEELKRIISEQRIRVLFTGFLTGREKLSALVDADVLVQPSKFEAGARPSLEAILCGTPAVVTRNTGAGVEIGKFDGGYLVDYGNVNELASAIKCVIENPKVAQFRTEKAKEYIKENLSLDKQIVKYEEVYA